MAAIRINIMFWKIQAPIVHYYQQLVGNFWPKVRSLKDQFSHLGGRRPMTDAEKIEFLGGRTQALLGFAIAVIMSHPNPPVLAGNLEEIAEINLARAEAEPVTDDFVEGVLDIKTRLLRAVAMAQARNATP
jgi:hypothetical protein